VHTAKSVNEDSQQQRQCSDFRRGRNVQRDRRARAFVDVRHPHMERYGAKLERNAHDQECKTKPKRQTVHLRIRGKSGRHFGELQGTGHAVDPRDAVKQRTGRNRTQYEILHRRLGRIRVVPVKSDQRILRQRQSLEAEVHRQHAVR